MAPKRKLTDQQVKTIRRRSTKGEHLTVLAVEYDVNRKTLRRRLDALAQAEAKRAERIAATRLGTQAAAERQKLHATLAIAPLRKTTPRGRPIALGRSNPHLGVILSVTGLRGQRTSLVAHALTPADWYVSATPTAASSNGSSLPSSTACSSKAGRSPELDQPAPGEMPGHTLTLSNQERRRGRHLCPARAVAFPTNSDSCAQVEPSRSL